MNRDRTLPIKNKENKADKTTQNEIERLIAGEAIEKAIRLDLTHNELDTSIANLKVYGYYYNNSDYKKQIPSTTSSDTLPAQSLPLS